MDLTLRNIKRTSSPEVHYRITYSAELLKDNMKVDEVAIVIDIGPLGRQYHSSSVTGTSDATQLEKVSELAKELYAKNKLP